MVGSASGLYSPYHTSTTTTHHHHQPHQPQTQQQQHPSSQHSAVAHAATALYDDSFTLLPPPGQHSRYAQEPFDQPYVFHPSAPIDTITLSHPTQAQPSQSPSQGRNPLGLDWLSPPPAEHPFESGPLANGSSAAHTASAHSGHTPPTGEQPDHTPVKADAEAAAAAAAGNGKAAQKARKEVSSVVIACKQWYAKRHLAPPSS